MEPFTLTQWVVVLLVFFLGIFLGGFVFASTKWKRRYREESRLRAEEVKLREEEVRRREVLEAERKHFEARDIAARAHDDRPLPRR